MTSTATLTYTAFLGGATDTELAALISAVPVPPSVLNALGLRVISDNTPVANPVVRTIVLALNPASTATATAALATQNSGSAVGAITVTSPGSGYVLPPIVSFTGGRPANVVVAGFPTLSTDVNQLAVSANSPAAAQAYLKVVSTNIAAGGSGYSAGTTLSVVGAQEQGATPAVLTPTIVGGVITAVAITNAGDGYTGIPQVFAVDPMGTGSGAVITAGMGVGNIALYRGGTGYISAPTVVLTPAFQALFPPTGDQAYPLQQLMTSALEVATMGPVFASPVMIA
jgi:hypothetical protein